MKRRKLRTALCVLLAGTVLAAFVAIAAEAGSQGDPLVTLSYLNDTFLGQLLGKVDSKLTQRDQALRQELEQQVGQAEQQLLQQISGGGSVTGTAASYSEVSLSDGQTLYGSAGCEVMLRSGSASCVSEGKSTPGLVDICLCNSAPVRPGLVERYKEEDAVPIVVDKEAIEALGVELITRPLASETLDYARHSFARLSAAVMSIYEERASTRIL